MLGLDEARKEKVKEIKAIVDPALHALSGGGLVATVQVIRGSSVVVRVTSTINTPRQGVEGGDGSPSE